MPGWPKKANLNGCQPIRTRAFVCTFFLQLHKPLEKDQRVATLSLGPLPAVAQVWELCSLLFLNKTFPLTCIVRFLFFEIVRQRPRVR
jgi:hypothetical protein